MKSKLLLQFRPSAAGIVSPSAGLAFLTCLSLTGAASAANYTWDGSTDLWSSLHWLPGPVAGPVGASNVDSATINSGTVSFAGNDTFGNAATSATPVINLNAGGMLASGGFFNAIQNLNINGGTLLSNGGVNSPFGAFALKGTVTVGGSTASLLSTGGGSFNTISVGQGGGGGTTTFSVADVTGNSSPDLVVSTVLNNLQNVASGITKTGAGTMQLTAANTYTGNTIVTGGTLHVAAGGSITNAAKINTQTAGSIIIDGTVSMAPNANFGIGAGLTGTTGFMTVNNGGVLTIGTGSGGTVGYAGVGGSDSGGAGQKGRGTLTINAGGTVNVAAGGTGPGGLDGTSFWINPYGQTGASGINLDGGTLSTARPVQDGAGGGVAFFNLNGGTVRAAGAVNLFTLASNVRNGGVTLDSNGFAASVSAPMVHSAIGGDNAIDGGLTKTGAGTITLTSNGSTYTGNVSVNQGTLALQTGLNGPAPAGTGLGNPNTAGRTVTVASGATLQFRQHDQLGNDVANPQMSIIVNGGTIAAATGSQASGNGPFNILPAVTLNGGTLTSANGAFANVQSFSLKGDITVTGSTPSIINTTGTPALLNGIHLSKAGGVNFNVADVTSSIAVDLTVSAPLITGAVGGINAGPGVLNKLGAGTMTLTAANTYTGATTIQAGTLALSGGGSLASTLIEVQAAGTFDVSAISFSLAGTQTLKANGLVSGGITTTAGSVVMGSGTIDGNLTIGGNLAPGNSPGTLTLTNDNLTLGSASTGSFELGGTSTAAYDRVTGINSLTLDGTITVTYFGGFNPAAGNTFDLFDFTSVNATGFNVSTDLILPSLDPGLTWDTSSFTSSGLIAVAPEPSAAILAGLTALALLRRRRA